MKIFEMSDIEGLTESFITENLSTVTPIVITSRDAITIKKDLVEAEQYSINDCIPVSYRENLLVLLTIEPLQLDKDNIKLRLLDVVHKSNIGENVEKITIKSLYDYGSKNSSNIKHILHLTKGKKQRLHQIINEKSISKQKLGAFLTDLVFMYSINCSKDSFLGYNDFFTELQTLFPLSKINFKEIYEDFTLNKNVSINKFLLEKMNG